MFFFKPIKAHNMVVLMVNLWFKDLNLVVNDVGHSFIIEIVAKYDREFFLPTLKTLYQKHHGWSNTSSIVVKKPMHNSNVIFGVGVSKEETCFKQVNVISFNSLQNVLNSFFFVSRLKFNFCYNLFV
jgi:hypothetical protein